MDDCYQITGSRPSSTQGWSRSFSEAEAKDVELRNRTYHVRRKEDFDTSGTSSEISIEAAEYVSFQHTEVIQFM